MKILLVIPSQYCGEGGVIDRSGVPFGRTPNMSVIQVAACTPPGHEVEVVDDHFEEPNYDGDYDLVGITAMTPQAPRVYEIAAKFREKGKKVVLGGYHPTLAPEDAAQHCDAIVMGEGELVWPVLLEDAARGELKPRYKADKLCDLNEIPAPRYDLLYEKGYHYTVWPVQFSRGCPLDCSFCTITAFYNRSYRVRSVEKMMEIIDSVPTKEIMFIDDDMFIGNRNHNLALFEAMASKKLLWTGSTDIKSADHDELLKAAYKSGCRYLYIGFESFSQESLQSARKGRSNKITEYERVVRKIHQHRISITASFIIGLDHDKPEHSEAAADFIIRNKITNMAAYMLIPFPGTPLRKEMSDAGRILTDDYNQYTGAFEIITHPNFAPGEMMETYWKFCQRVYSLPSIVRRFMTLRRYMPLHVFDFIYNTLFLRYWVMKRVHPHVANSFPPWLARIFLLRSKINTYLYRMKKRRLAQTAA